ncbi:dnaJ homolog subfamily C member 28 [Sabethes cyaneus]|uniref:dnaJ homolog subfamily C member 28 n=1 Tax=Sabethes cyaneus TaxID=53552 RepID=UPI00237E2C0E|nr:dnaJ homolog subfamily C member 28 [Sabethes cyaneus]
MQRSALYQVASNTSMFFGNLHIHLKCPFLIILRSNFTSKGELYNKCYHILGVTENSDQNMVRQAYIALVKKLHPDSGHPDADVNKFQEVDAAFRILQQKFAKSRRGIVENLQDKVKTFDIRHTAPQHRQYLSFDGIGVGTPAQRQKQYQSVRAQRAQERVLEHRMSKAQASEMALMKKGDHFKKHEIKTKYGFDRVVEDLIQEAMSRGDFSNLSGFGKPLPDHQSQNPYVDFTTAKINKIMLDNGFTPEWITLHKEIREDIESLKNSLYKERSKLGEIPLTGQDEYKWDKILKEHEIFEQGVNRKIDKFNLIVPVLNKQMVRFNLAKIGKQVLETGKHRDQLQTTEEELTSSTNKPTEKANIFSLLETLLK